MRPLLLLLTVALCACGREQSFEERYSRSENAIEQRARELDRQLDNAGSADAPETDAQAQPN